MRRKARFSTDPVENLVDKRGADAHVSQMQAPDALPPKEAVEHAIRFQGGTSAP
jgi:hypothetical protein